MNKTLRGWFLAAATACTVLMPLQGANAWDSHAGYWGKHDGYWGGYHRGSHRYGCRGCGVAGAAIAGLAIGGLIGNAMANSWYPPPARYRYYDPPERCDSVVVDGQRYYNCGRRGVDYDAWDQ